VNRLLTTRPPPKSPFVGRIAPRLRGIDPRRTSYRRARRDREVTEFWDAGGGCGCG
jgi:hypothetical protein